MRRTRWLLRIAGALILLGAGCSSQQSLGGSDSDGKKGGNFAFDVKVDDTSFTPSILKAQNDANVTVTLTNAGSKPHDLVVACMGSTCFPDAGAPPPVAPGASVVLQLVTPDTEGIYTFQSDLPGDTQTGQFVVQ